MAEQWRLICDPPLPGATNMERDLAIMQSVAAGTAPPTLRLYSWSPPAVSIGCFQKAEEVVDRAACRRLGVDLVRRPTGGRAVLHYRELTYSIAVPESHPLIPGGVLEAYRLISRGILAGFKLLNIQADLVSASERGAGLAPGSCFDTPSAYEVRVAGKKAVGSAQLRRNGVLLQHGAIPLELPPDLYRKVLLLPEGKIYHEMLNVKVPDPIGSLSLEQLSEALVAGFTRAFKIEFLMGSGTLTLSY